MSISVVDPNTMNLDPVPGFWQNFEFGSGSIVMLSILKKCLNKASGRAVDPHSYFADPDLAVLLNADPAAF